MHFYAWQKGLKTGMYYLRSKAATDPIKFTLSDEHQQARVSKKKEEALVSDAEVKACSLDDPDCLMCGS